MAKETRFDPTPFSFPKHRHIFAKLFVSVLLVGLAFRFLISDRSPVYDAPIPVHYPNPSSPSNSNGSQSSQSIARGSSLQPSINETAKDFDDKDAPKGTCNLFIGDWVPNPSGPVYTNESCPIVEPHQNCMKNGRPDSGYLYWRWKPRDCDLPTFDAKKFLDSMRNKAWAFIGDSISRNHVQSLLCILAAAEAPVEFYHDEEYKSKKWLFPSHNFTLAVIWSPFLVKADIHEDINGVSTSEIQLHLGILDPKWTSEYQNFDYIVTSGGKWFLKTAIYWENETVVGCHYCPGKNLTELGFDHAYRQALKLVLNFLTTSGYKGTILFRTSTPDHFENGEWFSGGTCNRTVPFSEGADIPTNDVDEIMRKIELEEFKRAATANARAENGVVLKLLDTTQLSLLRPDGHPGPYRQFHPFAESKDAKIQNDCLHWCLPGPIDSWSDIVMEMVLK